MVSLSYCYFILFFFPSIWSFFLLNAFSSMDRYIDEEDLLRFMIKEEVDLVFPLFEVSENRQIDRKALTDWVASFFFLYLLPL